MRLKPAWFDAFFILRPTLFFPAWTAFLAGYHLGGARGGRPLLFLLWLACASGASFLLNQLADRREDGHNGKLLPLWESSITPGMLRLELGVLGLATLTGGMWAGAEQSALLVLFFIIAGILYNFPPLRLKARPILGIASCSVGGLILFAMGARSGGVEFGAILLRGFPYMLAGAGASLLTHVPDLEGDRVCGVRTFVSSYGLRAAGGWAAGLVAAALLVSIWLKDFVLLSAAIISLPLFIRFFLKPSCEAAETAVKVAIFSLALAVGTTWPPLLLMIALYYPFARWYHRARLGLDYPTFKSSKAKPAIESSRSRDAALDSWAAEEST